MSETPESVINNANETLRTAKLGLKDFLGEDPSHRIAGFRNAVVFGRAVTNVLEHLRSKVDDFDDWYKPKSAALGEDANFARLYKLRSQILKEGAGGPSISMTINSLNTDDLAPLMSNPPAGAKGFFIGDQTGGSGWEVEVAEGVVEKYYIALPSAVSIEVRHELGGEDAGRLLTRYLASMEDIVREARMRYVKR